MSKYSVALPLRRISTFLLAAVGSFACASTAASHAGGSGQKPLILSTPCRERLIVRNAELSARTVELHLQGGSSSRRLELRGKPENSAAPYASTILKLPDGGVQGSMIDGPSAKEFDSRSAAPCVTALPASPPGEPLDDYLYRNAASRRDGQPGAFPGVVRVMWTTPLDRPRIDSLLIALHASVVGAHRIDTDLHDYYLYFDGDDSLATLALQRSAQLQASSLVYSAAVVNPGINMVP